MLEIAAGSEKSKFFKQMFLDILTLKKGTMELTFKAKCVIFGEWGTEGRNFFLQLSSSIMAFTFRKSKQILLRLKGANFTRGRTLLIVNF